MLVNTVPTRLRPALRPGAVREELVARLGSPNSSSFLPLTSKARLLITNSNPTSSDLYRVSGLVQIANDPCVSDWNVYPVAFILTAGLSEVFMFPFVSIDMTQRSLQQYDLRVWYDSAERLIAYERRKRNGAD